jgi:hypothetical protein
VASSNLQLVAEIGRRSSDWTFEQITDRALQDPVHWQPDRIFDPFRFEKRVTMIFDMPVKLSD